MNVDEMKRIGCTCYKDGSYIFSCPVHGERETLIHDAEKKLRRMTVTELRQFIDVEEPVAIELDPRWMDTIVGMTPRQRRRYLKKHGIVEGT